MSKDQMRAVVQEAAEAFANLDRALQEADAAAVRVIKKVRQGVSLGMVPALRGKQMIGAARKLVGMIGGVEEAAAVLHADCTKVASANGVDTGQLITVGGVVLPAGGGGR